MIGSSLTLLVAALAIIGWKLVVPSLLSPIPGLPQTSPINAFILILLALALLLTRFVALDRFASVSRRVAHALVAMAAGLALHALTRYALGLPLEFEDPVGPVESSLQDPLPAPGRPSPHTAVTFVFLCCALVSALSRGGRGLQTGAALAVVSMSIPWIALFGYASGFDPFYAIPGQPQTGMGIYTALALLALAFGIMGLSPDSGLLALWRSRGIGGVLTRWLLPVSVGAPLLLGSIAVTAQEAGYFNTAAGFALICAVNAIVLAGLTILTASILDERDGTRRRAAAERERLLAELQQSGGDLRQLQKGFVTVCAWTRRVLDGGRWVEFEEFLQNHLQLRFSHGMSTEAAESMKKEIGHMVQRNPASANGQRRIKLPSCVQVATIQDGGA